MFRFYFYQLFNVEIAVTLLLHQNKFKINAVVIEKSSRIFPSLIVAGLCSAAVDRSTQRSGIEELYALTGRFTYDVANTVHEIISPSVSSQIAGSASLRR